MAIELSGRTKVIAGVVAAVVVLGGAAWFFLDDIMSMFSEPPPKAASAAKAPAKAAAEAPKSADAAKPAAEAPKAAAVSASAGPIPTDPDKLVAEVVSASGAAQYMRSLGVDIADSAAAGSYAGGAVSKNEPVVTAMTEIAMRAFEPESMAADVAKNLKASFSADRLTRFLEFLRQPAAQKLAAMKGGKVTGAKSAVSPERQKLIATLDEITRSSEMGLPIITLAARDLNDQLFGGLQKAKHPVSREARQQAGSKVAAFDTDFRGIGREAIRDHYRDLSDQNLEAYLKLFDTDLGRSGWELLAGAARPALESRARAFAKETADYLLKQQMALLLPEKPAAMAAEEKPAEKLATAAPAPAAAPAAEAPGYKRAPNTPELYTRYNDLITAAVMRDSAAVKELLADGKYPDARQKDGVTPLMVAAANGDVETAQMLLAKGADPNLRAAGGKTALSLAKERNAAAMMQLLQSRGAKE